MVVRVVGFFSRRAFLFLIAVPFFSAAQFYSLPTDYDFNILTTRSLARPDTLVHPGMQPYIPLLNKSHAYVGDTSVVFKYIKDDPAIDFIFRNHFIHVKPKAEPFVLKIDPLLDFEGGKDSRDSSGHRLYNNSRGFVAAGTIGSRFYFETMLSENQSVFPSYVEQAVTATGIVPGQGRWKPFKAHGFDYAFATGIASIQLFRNINLQIGHGKHKVGHGYRSLLLSDNSFNYPFARLTQQWFKGRLRYTNVYASFMELVPASQVITAHTERLFRKKAAAFQYLEVQPLRMLTISFFQGMVWKGGDEKNRQHLTWQYYNPVIYSQLISSGLDDAEKNLVVGADMLLKLNKSISMYGQFMLDRSEGIGCQGGLKYFDVFGIRHLSMQAEFNGTGKYAYTSTISPSYSHYNEDLAFKITNGTEQVYIVDYRNKRFFCNGRANIQNFINKNHFATHIVNVKAGYLINPRYNLQLALGYVGRRNLEFPGIQNTDTDYFYISFKTSIYSKYYDF